MLSHRPARRFPALPDPHGCERWHRRSRRNIPPTRSDAFHRPPDGRNDREPPMTPAVCKDPHEAVRDRTATKHRQDRVHPCVRHPACAERRKQNSPFWDGSPHFVRVVEKKFVFGFSAVRAKVRWGRIGRQEGVLGAAVRFVDGGAFAPSLCRRRFDGMRLLAVLCGGKVSRNSTSVPLPWGCHCT